ncbi:hypothetical protein QL285_003067 [Trifolium repens]|nr:hypothetical protein QL285_003067 [Trifolium repens]
MLGMLVEVDVTQALPQDITIRDNEGNNMKQPVEYEWKPLFVTSVRNWATFVRRIHLNQSRSNGSLNPQQCKLVQAHNQLHNSPLIRPMMLLIPGLLCKPMERQRERV